MLSYKEKYTAISVYFQRNNMPHDFPSICKWIRRYTSMYSRDVKKMIDNIYDNLVRKDVDLSIFPKQRLNERQFFAIEQKVIREAHHILKGYFKENGVAQVSQNFMVAYAMEKYEIEYSKKELTVMGLYYAMKTDGLLDQFINKIIAETKAKRAKKKLNKTKKLEEKREKQRTIVKADKVPFIKIRRKSDTAVQQEGEHTNE